MLKCFYCWPGEPLQVDSKVLFDSSPILFDIIHVDVSSSIDVVSPIHVGYLLPRPGTYFHGMALSFPKSLFLCLATVTKRDVSFGLCSQEQNSLYNKQVWLCRPLPPLPLLPHPHPSRCLSHALIMLVGGWRGKEIKIWLYRPRQ